MDREPRPNAGLGLYLALTGAFTVCAYPLSCNVAYGAPPVLRYLLFGLLIPVGLFGMLSGVYLVRRVNAKFFYQFAYVLIFLLALDLIYEGARGIWLAGAA